MPPPGPFRATLISVIVVAIFLYIVLPLIPDDIGQIIILLKEAKNEIGAIVGALLVIAGATDSLIDKWQDHDPEPPYSLYDNQILSGVSQRLLKYDPENLMTGPDVLKVQNALNVEGFNLNPNGEFDADTVKAVRTYQSKHGLTEDGIVGPIVRAKLRILYAKKA